MEELITTLKNPDVLTILGIGGILFFTVVAILIFFLLVKIDQVKDLRGAFQKMARSFDELDEQAKLIVKTDLELNKAQEELDRRLNGLNSLQKASRLISTTLDQDEIFRRLDQSLISELGFEKNLVLMLEKSNNLKCRIGSGFSQEEIAYILSHLEKESGLMLALREGHSFSSLSSPKQRKEKIIELFNVEHFILIPILTQAGMIGVVFVGNHSGASSMTEGDEELLSILANQIGQSLENAQLFEQVYRSRQELESKIQERTKQLAAALEELKKISKLKSEFVSAVSHELRTPLTSIKGYASILITGKVGDIPPEVRERLEKINKHSDNLVKLINDLLDISRIESGRAEMKFILYDVGSIAENVRDLLAPQMREKGIQFKTEIAAGLPEIMMDLSQIERVLINLMGNAIKFTPPQGTITFRAQRDKEMVVFSVTDTGIGIKEDEIPKLFNEFYRVENEINQKVKGTGLGLVLAKKIIEAHHGKIGVTSKLKEGTTFSFTLPLTQPLGRNDQ